jgi:putative transcriptional regulator
VAPDVEVRAIREGQGLTREQFAERYGLQVRAIQEWEQGRRKPEPAVRAYMLVIKNQPAAVRRALTAAWPDREINEQAPQRHNGGRLIP